MEKIVLSGINLHTGGTLTIYKEMVRELIRLHINDKYEVICFVYKKELFDEFMDYVKIIEIPEARKNYFIRLYYENIYFNKYSRSNNIYIWISVQDITPRVKCKKLYTYCHNPMMFYKVKIKEIKYAKRLFIFSLLYKYVYRMNIHKNTYVVVQQNWIREVFKKLYKMENILVARPKFENRIINNINENNEEYKFVYASQATFFKNFELICKAAEILIRRGIDEFCVTLTIDGTESLYSHDIYERYKHITQINWVGFVTQEEVFELYGKSDCLIFPSKLETWGLPISEYECTGKPMIVSNLPYAYETVGNYDKVCFVDPYNEKELADFMEKCINGDNIFTTNRKQKTNGPEVNNWNEFWNFIMQE